jgi:hypothetical protein
MSFSTTGGKEVDGVMMCGVGFATQSSVAAAHRSTPMIYTFDLNPADVKIIDRALFELAVRLGSARDQIETIRSRIAKCPDGPHGESFLKPACPSEQSTQPRGIC